VVAVSDVELSAKLERFRDVLVWCNLWRLQVAPYGQANRGHEAEDGWCVECGGCWPCAAIESQRLLDALCDEGEFSVDKHPSLTASARGEAEPTPGSGDGR
jgi:hypothetical protein